MSNLFEVNEIPEDFNELLSSDLYFQVCSFNQNGVLDKDVIIEMNNAIFAPENERKSLLVKILNNQEQKAQKIESEEEIQYI